MRTTRTGKLHVAPEASFRFDYRPRVNTRKVRDVAVKAREFLNANEGHPFFLMVNYSDPHAYRESRQSRAWFFQDQVDGIPADPIKPSGKTIFPWQGIDTPEMRVRTAGYYNTVKRLDIGVGLLMNTLKAAGHDGDTLVIFVGDHGPPFCRGKTTCYEAGLRVPFIVRWPGVSTPFASDAMVSTIDILPTILDATGQPSPGTMHGRSLRPVVSDPQAAWRDHLVGEFHFHGRRPFYPRRAIRDERFKLIHNLRAGSEKPGPGIDGDPAYRQSQTAAFADTRIQRAFNTFADPPEFELYDLRSDPIEFENLAGKPEFKATEDSLKRGLLEYRRVTDDPFLQREIMQKMIDHARQ